MGTAAFVLALAVGAWAQSPPQQTTGQKPATSQGPPTSAAAGGSALVRQDPAEARRLFRELDRNADGYLTGEELRGAPGREVNWAALDRNRDGRISMPEFTVIRK